MFSGCDHGCRKVGWCCRVSVGSRKVDRSAPFLSRLLFVHRRSEFQLQPTHLPVGNHHAEACPLDLCRGCCSLLAVQDVVDDVFELGFGEDVAGAAAASPPFCAVGVGCFQIAGAPAFEVSDN
ncbi:hypothetical protein V22_01450 [Calycomorphotria hydatis]|uniref:Uncharacterized protein n=1 Tax=Calycomorphotria hydatis TaxID=2528027 RepID=A0A517T3J4_9PLAN|nr:hypothetical protein V22_01450 [Calycomorphotria hydatis]